MNAFQLGKIVSAITPETAKLSKAMSGNARICPEMPGQNMQNEGTKPKQKDKDEGRGQRDEGSEANAGAHPKPLPPRQMAAARLLLRGKSAAAVGRLLEVNERTVRRWLDDPRFVAEVNALASPKKSSSISPMSVPGSMSANARYCPEMSAQNAELAKRTQMVSRDAQRSVSLERDENRSASRSV